LQGTFGKALLAKFVSPVDTQLSSAEQALFLPSFVAKLSKDDSSWVVAAAKQEAIVGRLASLASVPESPLGVYAGIAPGSERDPPVVLMKRAGSVPLSIVASEYDPAKGPGEQTEGATTAWQSYVDGVTFIPKDHFQPGASAEEKHHIYMARTTDAILVALSQLSLGVQHLHSIGVSHQDLKPDNTMVSTKVGADGTAPTVRIIDMGLADLSLDYFRDGATERKNGDPYPPPDKPVLPREIRDYEKDCKLVEGGERLLKLLQHDRAAFGGTLAYANPLRLLVAKNEDKFKPFAAQFLGIGGLNDLIKECNKYEFNSDYRKPSIPSLHRAHDLSGLGVLATELLVGIDHPDRVFFDPLCNKNGFVDGMSQNTYSLQMDKMDPYCSPPNRYQDKLAYLWSGVTTKFALMKWLDGEKLNIYKAPSVAVPPPQGDRCGFAQDPLASLQSKMDADSEYFEDEEEGLKALGGEVLDADEKVQDTLRRRAYAWLYALSRYSPAAQGAVSAGRRTEHTGSVVAGAQQQQQRFADADASRMDAEASPAAATPSPSRPLEGYLGER
jgi:serine/threonine protein kinase